MGLILPGLTPDVLGEVYRYVPSVNEMLVGGGIWGIGALLFTFMVKVANAVTSGELHDGVDLSTPAGGSRSHPVS
jgi:molybdopterin-containing oxidoreductase family membrane subunit